MRLLLLSGADVIHTVRWANALAERGCKVHIVTLRSPSPELRGMSQYTNCAWPAPLGYYAGVYEVRRLARRIAPDVIHAHYASGFGTLGRRLGLRPWVLSAWGSDVYQFPDRPWKRRLVAANLRHADWVCSTSHAMAQRIDELCPDLRRLSVIPFGVDAERFAPAERTPARELTIGTVKTLRPVYGVDVLLRGFALCREQLAATDSPAADRLHLRLVGGGSQRGELEQLSQRLGVAQYVTFVGPVPHCLVPDELRKLDVYVAASRSESFGVAVIEASACGLPVVVTRVGGLPEVVAEGQTGLIVPPEDPAALANALSRLAGRSDLRERLGAAGRRKVVAEYRWEKNVEQMLEVYQSLASAGRIPRRRAA